VDLFRERPYVLWAIFLAASLLISLSLYFAFRPDQVERVLFFPENITGALKGEARLLPRQHTVEERVRSVVAELLLGPELVRDLPDAPVDTVARLVIVRNNNVYIDFSPKMAIGGIQMQEPVDRTLKIIERTIRFNFPFIRNITITIGGQLPGEPYFAIK